MKYVVIIGDGMADRKLKELDGKTPLQKAFTPNLDKLAREGTVGMVRTVPAGMHPGSDVANLSILGYDPRQYFSGRAPLEAASMGIELKEGDVAYRCNLVTLKYSKDHTKAFMEDYSAGHITSEEAGELIKDIDGAVANPDLKFHPGVSYRHLMVWANGAITPECTPPHDIIGKDITDYLPVGEGDDMLRNLMLSSKGILEGHPINKDRVSRGKNPANSIWLWGQGKKPSMPTFKDKYGLSGALVSAVDLTKGLGVYAGFEILKVPGVTGYIDTNYIGKADYSLQALENIDFVYIHVEAPDEAGHMGNLKDKMKAIEDFDALVVGTVMRGIRHFGDYKILVMPDHATPIEARTHTEEPVPFVLFESNDRKNNPAVTYDESINELADVMRIEEGHKLMDFFIKGVK